jgi:hypothetical protein
LGNRGPASRITVHHTSLLQQIPRAGGALVTMRGVSEFPSDGLVQLRLVAEDGSLEPAISKGRAEQIIDEHGMPLIEARAGLGSRQAWAGDAVTQADWLRVEEVERTVTIKNETDFALAGCRFADGMSVIEVGVLAPGGVATAERHRQVIGPLFMCTTSQPPVTLTAGATPVDMRGTTTVVVYRDRQGVPPSGEVPND